ncbi:MAG TPA: protocatechuate 3,4-dioxygenase subunit alpha [Mycobacterium sp.]|nr:protocatechuate 3,4-dioxygenase subunit alpha [Mycobacterium sp.]
MTELTPTPGQTVGPFFGFGLPYPGDNALVPSTDRHAIRLHGVVYDGAQNPVPDALIEIWQPGPGGDIIQVAGSLQRDGWTFTGWGRAATDAAGHYDFSTVPPGATAAGKPPFFALTVFARGLLNRLFTRAYLPDGDPDDDPLLAKLEPERRATLICTPEPPGYRFDIHLQGELETVFLDYGVGR